MLTQAELSAIKERAEKAADGPWRIGRQSPNGANNVGTMGGLMTAQTANTDNAEFIAHAREDIPKLVAEVERLREAIKTAERELWWGSPESACGRVSDLLEEAIGDDE